MMCQCRLISCNKCAPLVQDVDIGEAVRVWAAGIWYFYVLSPQFGWELL